MGDFNQIGDGYVRKSGRAEIRGIEKLKYLINDLGFTDLQLSGKKYTWRNSHAASRIDRALSWLSFGELIQNLWKETLSTYPNSPLPLRMKLLKQKLKLWNATLFGSIETGLGALKLELDKWDDNDELRRLSPVEEDVVMKLKEEQKIWLVRWRKNKINSVLDGGRVYGEKEEIRKVIVNYQDLPGFSLVWLSIWMRALNANFNFSGSDLLLSSKSVKS
ncbi:uncharacterized protein LOC131183797 [Hevea brasiliensis]|uniref:uncharacterized protein LOC131183797 n=1 Tax=Hevea brasiliensis TaxID=3981 RepID=UPI0025DEB489|nr:uncharacterized protein LOC131183797 [Hevea brasiliensis]